MSGRKAARVSIVIPTFQRPESLVRCLESLREQDTVIDEVIVVHRLTDTDTLAMLAERPDVRSVSVEASGVLAAMSAGVTAARYGLIGFLDDDVRAHPDWWSRIAAHFADPSVGGVGGRDLQADAFERQWRQSPTEDVGTISSWGRLVGNHHLGEGAPRTVDLLKGANMVFRRAALALPRGLRGSGAQAHFEIATSLWARERGWVLVYDPAAIVDHHPGRRFDADRRGRPEPIAVSDSAHNLVLAITTQRRRLIARRAIYGILVGDRETVGLARATAALAAGDLDLARRLRPSISGQISALRAARESGALVMVQVPEGVALSDAPAPGRQGR